jgi:dipeptidyl aminopeptidase/acylaminoacyl peptidase
VRVEPSAVQRHGSRVAYAPDGHAIAFTSNDRIWVRDLSESEPFEVDGSEGGFAPFWSPDSSRVGWFTRASLWSAPVRGGRAVTICQAPDAGIAGGVTAVWTRDGQIVFTTGRAGIFAVAALGGQAKEIVATDEGTQDLHDVQLLPDGGQGFLVVVHKEDGRSSVLALHRDGETQVLFEVEKNASLQHPVYDRRGYILLSMRGSERPSGLWAMRFDAAAGTVDGDPLLVEQGAAEPSLAGDGTLAFVSRPGGASRLVTTLDRNGRRGDVVLPARERLLRGTMSPDERHLAFSAPRDDPEFTQLWIRDLVRGIETPLTSLDGHVNSLGWSPDGHEIFFGVWFPDRQEVGLYRVPSDGSKEAELIEHSQLGHVSESDNSLIVLRTSDPDGWVGSRDTPLEVWRVPIDDPGAERKLLSFSTGQFMNIRSIAPNARHVLFEMFVNDQVTVFLARYPEFDRRMQVSSDHSARDPFFSADGSTIYYSAKETSVNRLFEVSFDPDAPTKLGRPQPLFELPAESYDVALGPGGEGFLLTMREQLDDAGVVDPHRGIRVVQNWTRKIEGPRP